MICPICGKEFEKAAPKQVTCGDPKCRKEHKRLYNVEYQRRRRQANPKAVREYNRQWMAKARKDLRDSKPPKEVVEARADTIVGDGYAERQKAKTLAMAGKVKI